MIRLQWGQPYVEFFAEAAQMIRAHWNEVGAHRDIIDLNPDHNRYINAERMGMLHILTARDGHKLVGYFAMMVMAHPRDKSVTIGAQEFIYADPAYRREQLGPMLEDEALARLEELKVNMAFFREKEGRSGAHLRRRGFEPVETTFVKVLHKPEKAQ
jgi:ribosomal protein S18 acetylase RimI-like enzyme